MREHRRGQLRHLTAAHVDTIKAFQSMDLTEKRSIAARLSVVHYAQQKSIICRTDSNKDVYFLLSGQVRVCTFSPSGKEIQFEDLQPGEMFGELAAIDGGGRTGDCVARTECVIAVMSATDFQHAMSIHNGLNQYVIQRLARMLRNQMTRVVEFSAHSVKDRLRNELIRLAVSEGFASDGVIAISDPPTHADFASRIGTHREAVTRELNRLDKIGVITWNRIQHQINDLASLKLSIDHPNDTENDR